MKLFFETRDGYQQLPEHWEVINHWEHDNLYATKVNSPAAPGPGSAWDKRCNDIVKNWNTVIPANIREVYRSLKPKDRTLKNRILVRIVMFILRLIK